MERELVPVAHHVVIARYALGHRRGRLVALGRSNRAVRTVILPFSDVTCTVTAGVLGGLSTQAGQWLFIVGKVSRQ